VNSVATPRFWKLYRELPDEVRELADKNYRLWQANPFHPSLHFKPLDGELWSARVGIHYRAIGVFDADDAFCWTWIGHHEAYDRLCRTLRP